MSESHVACGGRAHSLHESLLGAALVHDLLAVLGELSLGLLERDPARALIRAPGDRIARAGELDEEVVRTEHGEGAVCFRGTSTFLFRQVLR